MLTRLASIHHNLCCPTRIEGRNGLQAGLLPGNDVALTGLKFGIQLTTFAG
jgi:hypothetical protein